MSKIHALVLAVAGLSAGFASVAFAGSAADSVTAADAYIRAVPPGQPNSAAFMVLKNGDSVDHALVGAASPAANVVELHTHVHEDGMMKMRPVDKIDIKAGGETALQPGGLHIMLIDLTQPLTPGERVPVTLTFEDGTSKNIDAEVRKLQMQMQGMQHGVGH
ncbi:MAG: copper chaperone PCu(A)C [Gammaproteobacteria bacterium]